MSETADHWHLHAQRWQHVGPPLRPVVEDLKIFQKLFELHRPKAGPIRMLLLGVTPELARWQPAPRTTRLAVERNQHMIELVWPDEAPGTARLGDWSHLDLPDDSIDLIVGDGCFTTLPDRAEYQTVCASLARVLAPGGLLLHRFFVRPDQNESPDDVFSDLEAGKISRLEVFKWRLVMALVDATTSSVCLDEVYRCLLSRGAGDISWLVEEGFPEEAVATLEHYRGVESSYSFPRACDLASWMAPTFALLATELPNYELGERCPVTAWRAG